MLHDFFKILKEVVYKEYRQNLSKNEDNTLYFSLLENSADATCREAKFQKDKKQDVLILKFDKTITDDNSVRQNEPLFFLSQGIARSKADYLLFYLTKIKGEESLVVTICNMKSGKTANNLDQLKASESLAHFILGVAIRVYNSSIQNKTGKNYLEIQGENQLNLKITKVLFANDNSPVFKNTTNITEMNKRKSEFKSCKCGSDVYDINLEWRK